MRKMMFAAVMALVGSVFAEVTNVRYLDYVSFPKGAWVDTGIVPDGLETKIVFACEYLHDGDIFGSKDGEKYYTLKMNGSYWRWGVAGTVNNGSGWIGSYCGYWLAGQHTAIFNQRGTGDFLMDGEVMNNVSGAKSSSGKTLLIGCARSNTNNANLTGKIYALTMTDSEGTVKINLVPCAYTEDAVEKVGFYDTVSESYFTCTRTEAKYALTAGNDRKNELKVTGAPFEAASNEDAVEYGTKVGLTEAITLTAPQTVRFSFGGTATCTGYKLYTVDPLTGAKTQACEGADLTYTYTPGSAPSVLEWQWNVSFPTLTEGTTYYVSPMGDDANDGLSWTKALRAPQTAIDKAAAGDVILVAPGKFYSTENLNGGSLSKLTCMRISKAVKVIGIGGADATIMDASYNRPRNGSYITVDGAFLSGFSITNTAYAGKALNVGVEMTAGTISNIIFSIRQTWAGQVLNVKGGVGNALAQDIRMGTSRSTARRARASTSSSSRVRRPTMRRWMASRCAT